MSGGRIYTDVVTVGSIEIYQVVVDPNGVLSARIGSLAVRSAGTIEVLQNTDGATAWELAGGDLQSTYDASPSAARRIVVAAGAGEGIVFQDNAVTVGSLFDLQDSAGVSVFSVDAGSGITTLNDTIKGVSGATGSALIFEGGDSSGFLADGADIFLRGGAPGFGGGLGNVVVDVGNVGIGITNPRVRLEVQQGASGLGPGPPGFPVQITAMFWNQAASTNSIGINSNNDAFGISSILFGDTSSFLEGTIEYLHQFDEMRFRTNSSGTATLALDSSGGAAFSGSLAHTGATLGFFSAPVVAQPTVVGSRGGNVALASLITALVGLGLIVDGTTP